MVRIMPDTNVLLHSAFDPRSVARAALADVIRAGGSVLIVRSVEHEAVRKLNEKACALGLRFDPIELFRQCLATRGLLSVDDPTTQWPTDGINLADRHVAKAAYAYDAILVSSDAPLIAQAVASGLSAVLPWAIRIQHGADPVHSGELFRLAGLSRDRGSIFARVHPGGWSALRNVGRFTVVNVEGLGTLAYDTEIHAWSFRSSAGEVATLGFSLANEGAAIVCLNYARLTSDYIDLQLRADRQGGGSRAARAWSKWRVPDQVGNAEVGHRLGTEHFNGHIRHLVLSPNRVAKKVWKAVVMLDDGAPDPLSADVLDSRLKEIDDLKAQRLEPQWILQRG